VSVDVVLRVLIAFVLWGLPLVLVAWLINVGVGPRKSAMLLSCAFAVGVSAAYIGSKIMLSIPEYDFHRLFNSSLLQMDVKRVVETATRYWEGNYRTVVHPLQPTLSQPVSYIVGRLAGMDNFRAAQLTSVVLLSLSAALLFLTIYTSTFKWGAAFVGVAGYMVSFGYLLLSAFPESSAMATPTVILPYLIYAVCRGKPLRHAETLCHISAGVLSFGITITNFFHSLVVFLLRLVQVHHTNALRRVATYLFGYLAVVLALNGILSIAQRKVLYPGSEYWFRHSALASETRWLSIWWDGWVHPLRTLLQILVYPIVGPPIVFSDIGCRIERYPILQLSAESASLHDFSARTIAMVLALVSFMIYLLLRIISERRGSIVLAVAISLASQIVLHSIYGNELLLYAGNWLPVVWLGIASASTRDRYSTLTLLAIIVVILFHNRIAFRDFKSLALNASSYAAMQIPVGLPGAHEFSRAYVSWTGQFSPSIGTHGIVLNVLDTHNQESSLSVITRRDSPSHSLYYGFYPFPSIQCRVGSLSIQQIWYPVADGILVKLSIVPQHGMQHTPNAARVYVVIGLPGVTSSKFKTTYAWDHDNRSVLCETRVILRCLTLPAKVMHQHDPRQLFSVALGGSENGRNDAKGHTASWSEASVQGGNRALLLSWEIRSSPEREVDLWFHCPYTTMPLDASGKPLHEVANLPEYRPVARNYGPLTRKEIESYLRETEAFWKSIFGRYKLSLPDSEWSEGFWGAAAHLIQSVQQDGRIPVTPINYGVFTRDAAYMIYALLTAGQTDYARQAIEYLLRNPWEGRPYPEGDTPGHILWTMHKYWRYSRDKQWLQQKVPQIVNLAEGIVQMRSDGLSPVTVEILGHRRTIPANASTALSLQQRAGRQQPFILNYGKMDQVGLLYVNSVSLFGLRGAIEMLRAANAGEAAAQIEKRYSEYLQEFLALLTVLDYQLDYDERGHYFALWPAELHLYDPKVRDFFLQRAFNGKAVTSVWKYLDMDYAHNMLAAGRREAGHEVVARYLALPAFGSWKLLDEGGPSSEGYWKHLSNWLWDPRVAVPHGWSLASLCLLIRDCIIREEGNRLILLSGVPASWLADGQRIRLFLPTEYGEVRVICTGKAEGIQVKVHMQTPPSGGIWLHLPDGFVHAKVRIPVGKEVFVARKQ